MHESDISRAVVDGALTVHRALAPGLLESLYELTLAYELAQRGLSVERQVPIPIEYQGVPLGEGFRADLSVDGKVLLEPKSVEHLTPLHRKQIQTYLRLTGLKLGLLLNYGAALMKDGIVRCVNELDE